MGGGPHDSDGRPAVRDGRAAEVCDASAAAVRDGRAVVVRDGRAAPLRVRPIDGAAELDAALALRVEVFCGEQGVRLAAEHDGRDAQVLHLGAFEHRLILGTCRLIEDDGELVVQRVAVRAEHRGRGIGRALIDGAVDQARSLGSRALRLHAQLESERFYLRQGFARSGAPFLEEGIEHVPMRRGIALDPLS